MEIVKIDNYCELFFGNQKFILDPPVFYKETPIILTNCNLKVNKDKIFNSPGEYNIGDVYFYGYDDKDYISYLFQNEEGNIFYLANEPTEETLKKIKIIKIEIDALILKTNLKPETFSQLKPKIVFSFKDIDLSKFKKEKILNKVKVNLRKVNNLIYVLK